MNDDRLTGLLGSLRNERIDRIADDKIRTRLENAWATRMQQRSFGFRLRRFAPVLATIGLFAGLGGATMNAAGDSPLYGIRTAVEDAAVVFHADPADRAEYLYSLLEQRQDEAARLESTGNALAASKVREIEQRTLKQVLASVPQAPDTTTETPAPSPTQAPVVLPTASPTPTPTPTPTEAPTSPPAPTLSPRTPTPVPSTPRPTVAPTPVPTTARPTTTPPPTPAPTAVAVQLNGNVKNPDLTPADGVCVSIQAPSTLTADPGCPTNKYTVNGTYQMIVSAKMNQQVTVYAWKWDPVTHVLAKGYAMMTVKSTTVQMPDIKLIK
jgi:hypothetical protein